MKTADATVVIPSANRPRLLAQTLECLLPHMRRHDLAVLIGENVAFTRELRRTVERFVVDHEVRRLELLDLCRPGVPAPGQANMLRAVDELYERVETPLIFHCEDDWWLADEDFLTPSCRILADDDRVLLVRLTGDLYPPLDDSGPAMKTTVGDRDWGYSLSRYGGAGGAYGAFTFHPGLRRRSDYRDHFAPYQRFSHEAKISRHSQSLGFREAILDGVHARHQGAQASRLGAGGRQQWVRPCLDSAAAPTASHIDTDSDPGMYRLTNAIVDRSGRKPRITLFANSLPATLLADEATQTWIDFRLADGDHRPVPPSSPESIFLFLPLPNPAHRLHDCLFSVALRHLGSGFDAHVVASSEPTAPYDADWGLWLYETLGLIRREQEVVATGPTDLIHCRELLLPKYMRHRFAADWSRERSEQKHDYIDRAAGLYPLDRLQALRGLAWQRSGCSIGNTRGGTVLVYDRGDAGRRRWALDSTSRARLASRLETSGRRVRFISAEYGQLKPAEQAMLFHGADAIVMPHGAAASNLLFARPGTTVIELTATLETPGWISFAERLGIRHHAILARDLRDPHGQHEFRTSTAELDQIIGIVTA